MYTNVHMPSINATQARQSFFQILEKIDNEKLTYTITKNQLPIAELIPYGNSRSVAELFGAWSSQSDQQMANQLLANIKSNRSQSGKIKKKLVKI